MYYMIYVSQAKKPMDVSELEQLLQKSRAWNTSKALTGLLIYRYSSESKTGHFIQMLEGDKEDVYALYDMIRTDQRHHTVLTLNEGTIEKRMFSEWAMGFKNIDDATLARLPGHSRLGDSTFNPASFQQSNVEALKLLKFFHGAN